MRRLSRLSAFASIAAVALAATTVAGEPPAPPAATEAPEPQSLHIPVLERSAEQGILRPVPLSVELPVDLAVRARRVLVHYRLWGNPDWTTIELRRSGPKHEGAIPCLEVSTVTGDLRYYVRVHDVEGRVIATAGSLARPFVVSIKHETSLAEEGKAAPRAAKCPDPADCPRGLPGCPSEQVVLIKCTSDSDCVNGFTCGYGGHCERTMRRRNWFSIAVGQDAGVLSTTGACSTFPQENGGYACYRADGEQYNGNPVLTNEPPAGGPGQTRVAVGFERLVHTDVSIGLRAAVALGNWGPTPRNGTPFFPVAIAVRAAYFFGDDPFSRKGLRPYTFVTGGAGMFDILVRGRIREDPTRPALQGGNDLEQTVAIWKRAGDGFVGVGGGLAYGWSFGAAAFVEVAALQVFPFGAVVFTPTAGILLGL
jgi:hypothetical protein